jgi:Tol biopolymer transport system component
MTCRLGEKTVAFLLLFVFTACPLQGAASTDRDDTMVVFLSNRDRLTEPGRLFDVFLLNLNSMKSENLTRGLTGVVVQSTAQPKLNAKKNSVIFVSSSDRALIALNLETRTITKIAAVTYEATSFVISPDGEALLFAERVGTTLQLFEVNVAGGAPRNLTNNGHNNTDAAYSPDGLRIAYVCDKDGSSSIAVMNRDGSKQKILTNEFGDDRYPHWSPDSKTLFFSSSRSGSTDSEYHIYKIDVSGKGFKLFHKSAAFNTSPVVSPDNKYVAFVTNARGGMHKDIVLKDLASGQLRPVTYELNGANENFAISGDGKLLIFENSAPLDSEIWMYDVKTKTMNNISHHKGRDTSPAMGERSQGSR